LISIDPDLPPPNLNDSADYRSGNNDIVFDHFKNPELRRKVKHYQGCPCPECKQPGKVTVRNLQHIYLTIAESYRCFGITR
jgi:hypothetical protein